MRGKNNPKCLIINLDTSFLSLPSTSKKATSTANERKIFKKERRHRRYMRMRCFSNEADRDKDVSFLHFFFKWKIFKILNHIWKLIRISCLKMNFTLFYKINLLQYSPRITVVNRNFFAVCFPFPHLMTIAKKKNLFTNDRIFNKFH